MYSAVAAKLVLIHNYTYMRFISEQLRNRLRTYEKICIRYRAIVFGLYTFDWWIEVRIVKL